MVNGGDADVLDQVETGAQGAGQARGAIGHCPHNCLHTFLICDGDRGYLGRGGRSQYVNLPREQLFVNNQLGRPNLDCLSRQIRAEIDLCRDETGTCLIRVVDASTDNLSYSPNGRRRSRNSYSSNERRRNRNYQTLIAGQEQADLDENSDNNWITVSVPNGHAIGRDSIRILIDAAGNNQYRIEAKCHCGNRIIRSPVMTVKRRIWIVPFVTQGVGSRIPHFDSIQDVFRGLGIEIATPRAPYPVIADVGPSYAGMRVRLVRAILRQRYPEFSFGGITVRRLSGYVFPICFVGAIASRATMRLTARSEDLPRNMPNPLTFTTPYKLWRNMGDRLDWFVSARFVPDYGFGEPIEFSQRHFTDSQDAQTGEILLSIDTDTNIFGVLDARRRADPLLRDVPDNAPGRLELVINVISSEWTGYKFQHDLLAIATKLSSSDLTREEIARTIKHEIGHMLGLVPNGEDLDRSQMWYSGRGHSGNHCAYGVRQPGNQQLPDDMRGVGGDCVMFGGQGGNSFCRRCERAVRKTNLPGLSRVMSEQ